MDILSAQLQKQFEKSTRKAFPPQTISAMKRAFAYTNISKEFDLREEQVRSVGNTLIEWMNSNETAVKRFKSNMSDSDCYLLAQVFTDTKMTECLFNPGTDFLDTVANELISQADAQDCIEDLSKAVDRCTSIIAPCKPFSMRNEDDALETELFSNIFSKRQHTALLTAVFISSPDVLFNLIIEQFVTKHIPARLTSEIAAAHTHKDEIWSILREFLPNTYRKRATKCFLKNTATVMEELVQHAYSQDTQKLQQFIIVPPSLTDLIAPTTTKAADKEQYKDGLWLENFVPKLNSLIRSCSNDFYHKREVYPPFKNMFQQPEMSIMGFYLLLTENEVWARILPAILMLPSLSSHTLAGGKEQFSRYMSHNCPKVFESEERERLHAALQEAFSVLTNPNKQISSYNAAVYVTSHQLFSAAGLNLYNVDPISLNANMYISGLMKYLEGIGNSSEIVVGIVSALALMNHLGEPRDTSASPPTDILCPRAAPEDTAKTIDRLKAKVDSKDRTILAMEASANSLKQQIIELERRLKAREDELDTVREEKKALQEHADNLLDTLNTMSEEYTPESGDEEIQFPASLNGKKILTFGGFTPFLVGLQELLPELIVHQSNRRPEASSLRAADAVFIQTNRVSHSDFYYVLDTCRANGVPVRMYKTTGAKTCATQVIHTLCRLEKVAN